MTLEQATELFKTMTLINAGVFLLSAILMMALKRPVARLHGRLFGVEEERVLAVSYEYLGNYRLLILVFNLVPWIALLCLD